MSTALLTLPYKKDVSLKKKETEVNETFQFIGSMRGPMQPEEDHNFHVEFITHARDVQARVANVLNTYQMIGPT